MQVGVKVSGDFSRLKRMRAAIAKAARRQCRVGVMAGATYPGTGGGGPIPVSRVAAFLEYGWAQAVTPAMAGHFRALGVGLRVGSVLNLPPRPTFHATFTAREGAWRKLMRGYLRHFAADPERAVMTAFQAVGLMAQQDVQETIRTGGAEFGFAPRSPITIAIYEAEAARGGHRIEGRNNSTTAQPLVRSGLFLGSISFEIVNA